MNLIVFDIDDTLTHSEFQHQVAYVDTMKEFGITQINKNWASYQHYTDSHILKENYEANFSNPFDFSFIPDFENRMAELMASLDRVSEIKGAKNIIDYFTHKTTYALAFATGSLLKPAYLKLNQAGIQYNTDLVVGSNKTYTREGIVAQAIDKAKTIHQVPSFDHIISVGDGLWDLKTARNLGLHFIGIGMGNLADFNKENIQVHIKDWTDFDLAQTEQTFGIESTNNHT